MKKLYICLLFTFFVHLVNAQTGINTRTPNSDALMEINSQTNKGLLLPRVALTQTNSTNPMTAHVNGMIVFNTATVNDVSPGLYLNNGTFWIKMTADENRIGDIKNGFQSADHNGWYLLNGRPISTIDNAAARANATSLNLAGNNLPTATDRFLKTKTGAEALGTVSGVNSVTLTRPNLPNINFTGNTESAGQHFHNYTDSGGSLKNVSNPNSGGNNPVADNSTNPSTTNASGDHSHTVNILSGGSAASISYTPPYIVVNTFIYLGF